MRHLAFGFLLLIGCIASALSQPSIADPTLKSLMQGDRLVDSKNGFSILLDQPGMTWAAVELPGPSVKYVGTDKEKRTVYTIFVDRARYSDQTEASAGRYAAGLKVGFQQSGWTVVNSSLSPSSIPREASYRFTNDAVYRNGVRARFVEYVTSPNYLYSVGATFPAGSDESAFQQFVQSFRLLR
jgi:hypothetical protein